MSVNGEEASSATSPTLLGHLKFQDEAAWHRLVAFYTPKLTAWCQAMKLEPATTQDILQEVWISVHRSLSQFEGTPGTGSFRAWLRRILVRRVADFHRRRSSLPTISGGNSLLGRLAEPEAAASEPGSTTNSGPDIQLSEWNQKLETLKLELGERAWSVFVASVLEGQATAIVSQRLSLSEVNVRQIRSRGLRRLREL